jgi:hypothetical protein
MRFTMLLAAVLCGPQPISGAPLALPAQSPKAEATDRGISVTLGPSRSIVKDWRPAVAPGSPITASARVVEDGFDVVFEATNRGNFALPVTELPLPSFILGDTVAAYDFSGSGWPVLLSRESPPLQGSYPNELYSPVSVVRTADLAVGVSVTYPILEYRHDVSLAVVPRDAGTWAVEIRVGGTMPKGHEWWNHAAVVPPSESRRWTVHVRFSAPGERWADTLSPYRDWFRRTYGTQTYRRDGRPVRGIALASPASQSPANPDGWTPEVGRLDLTGYEGVARMVEQALRNSQRVLLWAPTGLASRHRDLNYPHQFASRWDDSERSTPRLREAPKLLAGITAPPGRTWGLWWGRSAQRTPCFDCTPEVSIDPSNPADLSAALAELHSARRAGATLIGLDAFAHSHNPIWRLVPLLNKLQESQPDASFCTEGRACDLLHRLAPTWLDAYQSKPFRDGSRQRIRGRHLLAELLLPGSETWAGMVFDRAGDPELLGPRSVKARQIEEISRVVELGYTPVVFLDVELDQFTARGVDK